MHIAASHHQFVTTDNLLLPGLLYAPPQASSEIVIWLHGMGDSGVFYSPKRITALAAALNEQGIALFAFNNRGAHNNKTLRKVGAADEADTSYLAGTHYELIEDCVADIEGAVQFLQGLDYEKFHLAGHSTGANKICVYDSLADSDYFSTYVLAGPGDDIGLTYSGLGRKRFERALEYAQSIVKNGKPLKTMPKFTGMHPFSAQSAADILNPDGHYNTFPYYESLHGSLGHKVLFAEFRAIKKPMLVIAGSEDEATASAGGARQALELLKNHADKQTFSSSAFEIIENADHSFHGHETAFAERVTAWLTR